jgi:hypothetical protein
VAQAEYYFDGRAPLEDEPFARLGTPRDWLWVQGWSARLRRFRLNYDGHDRDGNTVNADNEKAGSDQGNESVISDMGAGDLLNDLQTEATDGVAGTACGVAPDGLESVCEDSDSNMRLFDNLIVH